jgi:hypothetical protein
MQIERMNNHWKQDYAFKKRKVQERWRRSPRDDL